MLLLILQRLYGTRSGTFRGCPESGFQTQGNTFTVTPKDDIGAKEQSFVFYPEKGEIKKVEKGFTGRASFIFGGRRGPVPSEHLLDDADTIRERNDHVIKICWLEEGQQGEADILQRAKEHGRNVDLIGNHIPRVVYDLEPTWACSSTKDIRRFLGLPTEKALVLRITIFQRLTPITALKEEEMLIAYLQCFFCRW